jgi:hypothetical protein
VFISRNTYAIFHSISFHFISCSFSYSHDDHDDDNDSLLVSHIYTCILQAMGIVHVLTGPDHLSAIATLSANVGNFQSFWYGVRWGIGHSIGLVVVGSIFIILSNHNDDDHHNHHGDNYNTGNNMNDPNDDSSNQTVDIPPLVESIGETFVGFFMLALGLYSMYKVWKRCNTTI